MDKKIKEKIWYLFYERIYSLEEIEKYFKHKYTERQIRDVTREKY